MKRNDNNIYLLRLALISFLLIFYGKIAAQSSGSNDAPMVFLDCQTSCFFDHIRNELSYLNFMRDRQNADVYMMLTSFQTGSGGREWTLSVKGQKRFEGMADTLVFYSDASATDGQIQDLQVEKIQLAFLPFVLKTSLAEKVHVEISKFPASADSTETITKDPWNYWVFNMGGNFNFNGQESFANLNGSGHINIDRVTNKNKFNFSAGYDYSRSRFSLADEEFISKTRRFSSWIIYVHSISEHWSAGGFGHISVSTVANLDFSTSLRPAIEYNLFPYSEATKRQFTFLYNIGPFFNDYTDTTIFDVEQEWFVRQDLEIGYRQIEEWGRLDLNIEFANYLHDMGLLSLSFNPEIAWNIFKGFQLRLGGEISMVRNQLNIPKKGASNEEVLLQLLQLSTNYLYSGYIGINYRFGSETNNVVNTRF